MTLNSAPFEHIDSGIKTIGLRLNDEKRKLIKIDDKIIFQHKSDNKQTIIARVTGLHRFNSFDELYSALPLLKCGYTKDNVTAAKADDMPKYYTKNQETTHGVLGIEFEKIDI